MRTRSVPLSAFPIAVVALLFAASVCPAAAPLVKGQYLRSWLVCGQFPNPIEDDIRTGLTTDWLTDAGGETLVRPSSGMSHPSPIGAEAVWIPHVAETNTVDLYGYFDRITPHPESRVAYAFTTVHSPRAQDVLLAVGSDDGIRIWLNDELVHHHLVGRGTTLDEDVVGVHLLAGDNAILVKVEQDWGGWSFALRFVDVLVHGSYDLAAPAADLDVILHGRYAGRSVRIEAGPTPVAETSLKEGEGRTVSANLRVPGEHLPASGAEPLRIMVGPDEVGAVVPPHPGCLETISTVRARQGELIDAYALRQPWNDLVDGPDLVRRHRGMVARAVGLLDTSSIGWDDPRLPEFDDLGAMFRALDGGRDYLGGRRNEFWSAYYSRVDGSGQHFLAKVPADFDRSRSWPLLVDLHGGSARPRPDRNRVHDVPFLEVHPWGRGDTRYHAIGEVDVLDVIRFMQTWYPVDPDRIYITGESMGGSGSWWIASMYADRFAAAAPFSCSTDGMFPENLRNVPVLMQHGMADWIAPIALSRFGVDTLQRLGYVVEHREYPGLGHGIREEHPAHDWLLAFERPSRPECVTLTAPAPRYGRSYWVEILRFTDPHRSARITARVRRAGDRQIVTVAAGNIDSVRFDAGSMPIDSDLPLVVQAGIDRLEIPAPVPAAFVAERGDDGWAARAFVAPDPPARRPYRAGGAGNLYDGEPLLIVRGTVGDPAIVDAIREGAGIMSRHAGDAWSGMPLGGIPVRADSDLTDDEMDHCNLIVLGGPDENRLTAGWSDRLPVRVDSDGMLLAGTREPVDTNGAWLKLTCVNPDRPQRLVHLVWARGEAADARRFYTEATWFGAAAAEYHRPDEPDLEVREIDGPCRRRMQFTHDWQWRELPGADVHLPQSLATANGEVKALLPVMRAVAGVDYALGYGTGAEERRLFDPEWFRCADYAVEGAPIETMTARLTGEQLAQVYETWIADGEILALPEVRSGTIERDRTYTVVMLPGLTRVFASGRLVPLDVRRGPDCPSEALWPLPVRRPPR